MSIDEKKQALSQEGQAGSEQKPPPKEEKKDTSIIEGKPYLEGSTFEFRLRNPKYFETTKLGESDRIKLGKELFGSGNIDSKRIKRAKDQLDLGSQGEFRDWPVEKREKAKRLIQGISGE